MVSDSVDRLTVNRELWAQINSQFTGAAAAARWRSETFGWGLFETLETDLNALGDVAGLDVVELGCGTAYFSAWLARQGAFPVGVDLSPEQLETARHCQRDFGLTFPLLEANAECVPLPDESFDLVVSEYGASLWCDPQLWVREAARLLRPGGRLVFLTNSVLATMCVPNEPGHADTRLKRAQHAIYRVQWLGGGIEFHPTHGEWIRVLRSNDFAVNALHELHAPANAKTPEYYDIATADWARQWPVEDLWVADLAD